MGIAGAGLTPQVFADQGTANIRSVTLAESGNGQQRLVFELDKTFKHKVSIYNAPDRIVIDFINTKSKRLKLKNNKNNLITNLRQAVRSKTNYRVVLDVSATTHAKTTLRSSGSKHYLDVILKSSSLAPVVAVKKNTHKPRKAVNAVNKHASRKPIIVAIDAGHGGRDPGAVGRKNTQEKVIALQIAERLKKHVDRQPGMKGVLIRDGDYYIHFTKRQAKARQKKADVFVSIHADANPNSGITGSHVYILSSKGASSESAKWLAKSENSYDLKMGGAKFHGNKGVNKILVELSMSETIDKSLELANGVLKELRKVNKPLRNKVESASFAVLKSPDIPSMLVETAFISNVMEEKRLRTSHYQEKLAKAIFKGIRRYKVV